MNKGGDDPTIEALSVTTNGTYTATSGVDGYSPVVVDVEPDVGTKTITANGTYAASADDLDGYSSVTVAVSKDFYPKEHATLDDATRVESDDMRVLPMEGTDYYPYVYLGAMPYPAQAGDDYEPCGKYFAGQTQEHTVTTFLDLIDVATGESVSGYPQRVALNWSASIVDGGYMKIVSWTVKASGAVSVTTERYNPSYTKPLQDTKDSTVVTGGKLDAYVDASYYIDGGAGESVNVTTLNVSHNGTYTAPARTAYGTVNVDVQEQPWEPLEDGYSNFWFELTNDTLSPWLNFSAKDNDAVIDWGDGSGEQTLDTLTPTHTYARAGKYIVKVKGVTQLDILYLNTATNSAYMDILKNVELNSEVTSLVLYAFRKCVGLENVVIGENTNVGSYSFQFCGGLKTINYSEGANSTVGAATFYTCVSLRYISLPSGITEIVQAAFYNCVSLQTITIPALVANIGNNAFSGCSTLTEIHVLPTTPPTLGTNVFGSIFSSYVIYVPVGYGETYKAAAGWSAYADHIVEEGSRMTASQLRKIQSDDDDAGDMR